MARRKSARAVSGWLVLDKPIALGSTSAVARVRHLFAARKAGHAGTLDPLASGVLPIALGEATKTVPYAVAAVKEYRFTLRWGAETSTDDLEGAIVASSAVRPSEADIRACLPHFIGELAQIPPAFSAIHIDGARAYTRARNGEDITLPPRKVKIDALTLERATSETAMFHVRCGKGTYIRALARDIARHLGAHGHVIALRRERVGNFLAGDAFGLDKLQDLRHSAADLAMLDALLLPLTAVLDDIPALAVTQSDAARIRQGQAISPQEAVADLDPVLARTDKEAVAIGKTDGQVFRPRRVFNL